MPTWSAAVATQRIAHLALFATGCVTYNVHARCAVERGRCNSSLRERGRHGGWTVPSRSRKLLEREGELSLLMDLFDVIEPSGGRSILIRGEAGIGKTALVREFINRRTDSADMLMGTCDDLTTARPLDPFWDMARDEPSLLPALESDDRVALMNAVVDLASRSIRPTIMVIEDTQWADDATLDVISFLGRRIERMKCLLVLTYRDGDVDLNDPLRGVMGGLPAESVTRIRLGGLSLAGVSELVSGSGFDALEIFAATDGNPFLTIELASGEDGVIPASVQDSVLARMRRLSNSGQTVLRILSVMPGKVSAEEVAAVLGDASSGLGECEQRGLLLEEAGSVEFCHDLIRRTVEASLTPPDRVAINRMVLVSLPPETDPARLVHHAHASHDADRVIDLAPRAARAALATGSLREAVSYFRLLAPHIGELVAEEKSAILDDWASAEALESSYDSAMRLNQFTLDHYRQVGDRGGESRALGMAAYYSEASVQRTDAERLLGEAMYVLGSEPRGIDLAHVLEGRAFLAMQSGDADATIDLVDRAMDAAGPDVDGNLLLRGLVHKGAAENIANYPAGKTLLDEARQRAESAGDWVEAWRALINHAEAAIVNYDIAVASDYARRAICLSVERDLGMCSTYASATYSRALLAQGQWDQAEDTARDQLERTTREIVHLSALPVLGTVETRRGRRSAQETINRSWAIAVRSEEYQHLAPTASVIAEHGWLTANTAGPHLDEVKRVMELGEHRNGKWVSGSIAFWLWKSGELEAVPEWVADPWYLSTTNEWLAAARIWADLGCPYEQALALTQGDAAARLEALDIVDRLGATAVAAKLRKSMREDGITVPRRRPVRAKRGSGLTPRQEEVLLLLNEHLTNAEIADQLFLSPRTVEHHVAAVISKLDASSRDNAVEIATERGLLAGV